MYMTHRKFYWLWGALFLIFQAGYFYFSFVSPSVFLIGSTILAAIYVAVVLIQSWPPKNTTRRMVYWFGSILFVVLEADYLFSAPHSALNLASLIGTSILLIAYAADLVIQNWPQIWAVVKRLRRPPID
jgi:hypothetical protein